MQGTVERIWENQTKDNKKYHVLEIGGEKYSVWDPALMEGLAEGARVEYDWKQSGSFMKITGLRKIDMNPDFQAYRPNRRDLEIVRMSCLKSASEILHGLYIDPDVKVKKALDIAREFEKYVTGIEEGENAEGKAAGPG